MSSRRLSAVETSFLAGETDRSPAHIGNLALFAPGPDGPLTYDAVTRLVAERLDLVPAFRRRIVEVPFGLDRPYAVDDDELDLEFHVRQVGVPAPAGREELSRLVAGLHARRLDRARPLWELYLIEGLPDDQVGMYTKVHFVAVDPSHGTEIMTALLDAEPTGRRDLAPPQPRPPTRIPTELEMVSRAGLSLVRRPRHVLWLQRELARRVGRSITRQLPAAVDGYLHTLRRTRIVGDVARLLGDQTRAGAGDDAALPAARAPRVSFNRAITPHRRVAFASLAFDDVHAIKEAHQTTVHDVVMAVCAGGVRRWLLDRRELPVEPLLAAVPVLTRGADGDASSDYVSMMIAELPTNEADPLQRLARAHQSMRVAKERHDAVPANLLQDMARYAPPAVAGLASRLVGAVSMGEVASPPFNLAISNVPGPRHAVYCGGAPLLANYPLSVISERVTLHVSLVTYDDKIHLGIVTCREALRDPWGLIDDIVDSLEELRVVATARRRRRP